MSQNGSNDFLASQLRLHTFFARNTVFKYLWEEFKQFLLTFPIKFLQVRIIFKWRVVSFICINILAKSLIQENIKMNDFQLQGIYLLNDLIIES